MADVENLFREYVSAHRAAGEADPLPYLDQVEGSDRNELAALIDGYLARAPGRRWDAAAFAGSRAEFAADQVAGQWELEDEGVESLQSWRELLPALRTRAQVMRREVVERLASRIGHPDESDRIAVYYHQMELGQLPAEGVSNRVLSALAEIFGESAERLRVAGSIVGEGGASQAEAMRQVAFARTAANDPRYAQAEAAPAAGAAPADDEERTDALLEEPVIDAESDEVDRLFTGGPEAD